MPQIRQLEDHLGLKLFNRLNRAVELTANGRLMQPGIHEAFEQLHRTMRQLRRRQQTNVLTVTAGTCVYRQVAQPAALPLHRSSPEY